MSPLLLNSDRFHGSAGDIRISSYQDVQYCFHVIRSAVGGLCPAASSATRRSTRCFQACASNLPSSGGDLQCAADVKQRKVTRDAAKKARIDLTRKSSATADGNGQCCGFQC